MDATAAGRGVRVILAITQGADEIDRQAVEESKQLLVGNRALLHAIRHDPQAAVAPAYLSFQQELRNES